jgi:hypothetical protein
LYRRTTSFGGDCRAIETMVDSEFAQSPRNSQGYFSLKQTAD